MTESASTRLTEEFKSLSISSPENRLFDVMQYSLETDDSNTTVCAATLDRPHDGMRSFASFCHN